jgi:cytochrome c peroxidase
MAAAALWGAAVRLPVGLDRATANPPDNPASPAKIALGRRLFHDRRLSRDGSLSCADCHDPRRAFTDGRRVAQGIGRAEGERNVPTLVNRAWGRTYFWDGRAATLEDQVQQPVFNPKELGSSPEAVMKLLRSPSYRAQFGAVFGGEPALGQMSRALACYLRTIVSGESPYDRFESGDRSALSPSAIRGLFLFRMLGGCSACHNGPNLTDEQFHNTGVAWQGATPGDEGRAMVTHKPEDRGAFKTPTLREIPRTGPYMHDGSLATLEDVIEYYDRGGNPNPGLDSRIHPLHLTDEQKKDLLAFLKSFAGTIVEGE